jgi:hypothetical protein
VVDATGNLYRTAQEVELRSLIAILVTPDAIICTAVYQ